MLELRKNRLVFKFPNVHPDAEMSIVFHRTLRIPDDGKTYPLPPSMGYFPLRHVEDYPNTTPPHWKEHGGIFLPMYQAEAMWLQFVGHRVNDHGAIYPMIVKVGTGKKSALTGKNWRKGIHTGDYCVVPEQKWLDGYVIDEDVIGQFVAVPLGMGMTVEEQLGGDGVGGIQLEVFPMKRECFERRWPKKPPPPRRTRLGMRSRKIQSWNGASGDMKTKGIGPASASNSVLRSADMQWSAEEPVACAATMDYEPYSCDSVNVVEVSEMGLGAGGKMKQQVIADPYGKDEWSRKSDGTRRCFVHLANSMAWSTVTGEQPPPVVITAATYEQYGYPWYDTYSDDHQSLKGKKKLRKIKSVKEMAKEKGVKGVVPENKSVKPKTILFIQPGQSKPVQNGNW